MGKATAATYTSRSTGRNNRNAVNSNNSGTTTMGPGGPTTIMATPKSSSAAAQPTTSAGGSVMNRARARRRQRGGVGVGVGGGSNNFPSSTPSSSSILLDTAEAASMMTDNVGQFSSSLKSKPQSSRASASQQQYSSSSRRAAPTSTAPRPPTGKKGNSLLDRSSKAAEEAAFLLASVKKVQLNVNTNADSANNSNNANISNGRGEEGDEGPDETSASYFSALSAATADTPRLLQEEDVNTPTAAAAAAAADNVEDIRSQISKTFLRETKKQNNNTPLPLPPKQRQSQPLSWPHVVSERGGGGSSAAAASASKGEHQHQHQRTFLQDSSEDDDDSDDEVIDELETLSADDRRCCVDAACLPLGSTIMVRTRSAVPQTVTVLREVENGGHGVGDDNNNHRHHHLSSEVALAAVVEADAGCNGPGLGNDDEIMTLVLARTERQTATVTVTTTTAKNAGADAATSTTTTIRPSVLCYGDTVMLRSAATNRHDHAAAAGRMVALGVVASSSPATTYSSSNNNNSGKKDDGDNQNRRLGFLSVYEGEAVHWTVLPVRANGVVRLGHTATSAPGRNNSSSNGTAGIAAAAKLPVRSGEAVVLRHVPTGGLLSWQHTAETTTTQQHHTLSLLTDSYDPENVRRSSPPRRHRPRSTKRNNESSTLMDRLQRHNLIVPSLTDTVTFCLVPSTTPPAPDWLLATGDCYDHYCSSTTTTANSDNQHQQYHGRTDVRSFLNGSYLLDSNRNQSDLLTEATLFGPMEAIATTKPSTREPTSSSRAKPFEEHKGRMKTLRMAQLRTVQGQEALLLDELIGACLGLEGQYIKVMTTTHPSERGDSRMTMDKVAFHLTDDNDENAAADNDSNRLTFDVSLRAMVEEVLPLATNYARVRHFVATHQPGYEYGMVMQAFCERLDGFLQEYTAYIASLNDRYREESDSNTNDVPSLRAFQVQVQPCVRVLAVLERAVDAVYAHRGGALLNAARELQMRCYCGDTVADRILPTLIHEAAVPYMRMLSEWLQYGVLSDPHDEFMVAISTNISGDDNDNARGPLSSLSSSWESKYRIRPENVLEEHFRSDAGTLERVLAAGKYWNALRACNNDKTKTVTTISPLAYETTVATLSSHVHTMYHKASSALVRFLLGDSCLISSLRLMKRYFLLDQGDFFVNFVDNAEQELSKELSSVSQGRVQHWLNVSIQLTENHGLDDDQNNNESKNKTDTSPLSSRHSVPRRLTSAGLRCHFAADRLFDKLQAEDSSIFNVSRIASVDETWTCGADSTATHFRLTGFDAFFIDFDSIPFPISLILSQRALEDYQLLFRHLFFSKHVERRLVGIWQDHQAMKELPSLRGSLGPALLLRQRMLHFMQNLIYYIMLEVIEPNWLAMETAMEETTSCSSGFGAENKNQTVDDILRIHNMFLQRTTEACLLTNQKLVRALHKLMMTCLLFSDEMKQFMKATRIEDDQIGVAQEKQKVIYRNLHDRQRRRETLTRQILQDTMNKARDERQERVQRHSARVQREVSSASYQRMIKRFDEVFTNNLRQFMLLLSRSTDVYNDNKANLVVRLDFNGFVTQTMGLKQQWNI